MNTATQNLHDGLKSEKGGYGIRKVVAIFSVLAAFIISVAFTAFVLIEKTQAQNTIYVLALIVIWLVFAALLFGLVTSEQIISLKKS
jgi:hypothetical protein